MDIPRVTSPPSIHIHDFHGMKGPDRSSNRSITSPFHKAQRSMAIPNARAEHYVPPPLPPPRHIEEEDAAGGDSEIQWRNSFNSGDIESGGSVSSRSSLRGNWERKMAGGRGAGRPDYTRRPSLASSLQSQPEVDTKYDFSRHVDEGYHSLSGSSLIHQLHSERHLGQRHIESSSQAYDNKLLSKIGKPKTPPRGSASSSFDAASPTSSLSFSQSGRQPHPLKSLSISEGMRGASLESPFKPGSPFSNYGESPRSRAISPSLISSAASAKNYMDFRSPTWDHSAPPSAGERYVHQQRHYSSPNITRQNPLRRSESGSIFSNYDESADSSIKSERELHPTGGIKRGSQDQSVFSEPDSADFAMEDTGASNTTALRQLHLEDRTPPASFEASPNYYFPSDSKSSGMKRGASSPPPEASRGDKVPTHSMGPSYLAANNRGSPINPYAQPHGSVSSASSQGLDTRTYPALSAGNSSITSVSPHERLSPRAVSPSSEHPQNIKNEGPYYNQQPINPAPQDTFPQSHQRTPSDPQSAAAIARKMSSDPQAQQKPSTPGLQANINICFCCTKKPRKFETLEELRIHQSEKQYSCQYCSNKFKNKNEAERHQNSLHLRRHSWSCATLANAYDRAYHPSTAILPNGSNNPNSQLAPSNAVADTDICGYCGLEFDNLPAPDWEARGRHLHEVHKFGECNQSKKFFRADHFRQHLKHSHAGTSGKWTNMLESACMKEEPIPPTMNQQEAMMGGQQMLQQMPQQIPQQLMGMPGPQGVGAPIANMSMQQQMQHQQQMQAMASRGMQPMVPGMQQGRIDELHEGL